MEKNKKTQLLIMILCTCIVSITLYQLDAVFKFHTYKEIVYYEYLLSTDDEQFSIENFEIYKNESMEAVGGGSITLKEDGLFQDGEVLHINIEVSYVKTDSKSILYDVVYKQGQNEYPLDYRYSEETVINSDKVDATSVTVTCGEKEFTSSLHFENMYIISSANKEYRIQNAFISDSFIRLGKLLANDDIAQKYKTISLEYRYVKDESGDIEDNDNYVVFKKITAPIDEYIKTLDNGTYIHDNDDESLLEKELSVVVILSNDTDEYVFSMNLSIGEVGGYRE